MSTESTMFSNLFFAIVKTAKYSSTVLNATAPNTYKAMAYIKNYLLTEAEEKIEKPMISVLGKIFFYFSYRLFDRNLKLFPSGYFGS